MDQVITLLKVGVEGGDVSLVLAMTDAGIFSYRLATTSSFNGFLEALIFFFSSPKSVGMSSLIGRSLNVLERTKK